jgi:endonuclease-3
MATSNRAAILAKTHKTLKKHYQPVKPPGERSVLETVLYACCLQNAAYDKADEAFAKLQEMFFDWNEVRVTTATELAEVLGMLPNPRLTASQLKRCLQGVFETHYSFDLETLHKQNLGKAIKLLEEKYGLSPFGVGYVTQTVLGGHAIPLDEGAMQVMVAVGAASEAEAAKHEVPGLERAIPKSKGVEFGSLLHQLGADLFASPFGNARKVVLEIDPEAKDRLPKRKTTPEPAAKPEKQEAKPAKEPAKDATAKSAKDIKEAKPGKEPKASKDGKKPPEKPKEKRPPAKQPAAAAKKPASKGLAKKKPR